MFFVKILKYFFLSLLESSSKIKNLSQCYKNETVLICGDGLSSAYLNKNFNKYKNIICTNKSILNKNIPKNKIRYWIFLEPFTVGPTIFKLHPFRVAVSSLLRKILFNFKNITVIMHPSGRFFREKNWKDIKPIFLSPYNKIKLSNGDVYDDLSGAFQASLGIALLSGFKEIHLVGFDAWLLNPKNNLRWYSNVFKPDRLDYASSRRHLKFLDIAKKNCKLYVYTYRHYKKKFKFISEIKIKSNNIFVPGKNRSEYINYNHLKMWKKIEDTYLPKGYGNHKQKPYKIKT